MRVQYHLHLGVAVDKVRRHQLGFADNFDHMEALLHLFPKDPKLHFSQTVAHAAVYAKAKGQVLARAVTVDYEFVGSIERSSRLPDRYHIITLSPALIVWPFNS